MKEYRNSTCNPKEKVWWHNFWTNQTETVIWRVTQMRKSRDEPLARLVLSVNSYEDDISVLSVMTSLKWHGGIQRTHFKLLPNVNLPPSQNILIKLKSIWIGIKNKIFWYLFPVIYNTGIYTNTWFLTRKYQYVCILLTSIS